MQHVLGVGGVWDWGEWEKGMKEFCGKDWEVIKSEVENGDWEDVNVRYHFFIFFLPRTPASFVQEGGKRIELTDEMS